MEIFNREGIRIFSRNLKILLLEEGNSKIRVFVSIIEEFFQKWKNWNEKKMNL